MLYQLSYDPNLFNLNRLRQKISADIRCFHAPLLRGRLGGMRKRHSCAGKFHKVGENLYRYSSNGVYYARFRNGGKEIHKSLKTANTLQNMITKG